MYSYTLSTFSSVLFSLYYYTFYNLVLRFLASDFFPLITFPRRHCYRESKNEVILHFPYFTFTLFLLSSFAFFGSYIWSTPFCPIKSTLWPLSLNMAPYWFPWDSFPWLNLLSLTPCISWPIGTHYNINNANIIMYLMFL